MISIMIIVIAIKERQRYSKILDDMILIVLDCIHFSIVFDSTFSVATNQSAHYTAWRKKKQKVLIATENNNNRNNDNKWTGATVQPPRGIGGDLLRETRHRRRSEAGTTCKSEPPSPLVPPAGEIERNVHRTELETVGERAARERG